MPLPKHVLSRPAFIALLSLIALPLSLRAKPEFDLTRLTPVPADQPIPIEDFFRPVNIRSVTINDAGTHIAGIMSDLDDHQALMSMEVKTWEHRSIYGTQDLDVSSYAWLGNDHLVFNVTKDKRWADSMLVARLGKQLDIYYLYLSGKTQLIGVPDHYPMHPIVRVWGGTYEQSNLGPVKLDAALNFDSGTKLVTAKVRSEIQGLQAYHHIRELNEKHIVKRYPDLPDSWGMVLGYLPDRHGNLSYAHTMDDGISQIHRLRGEKWVPTPIDLDSYKVHAVADDPSQLIVSEDMPDDAPGRVFEIDATTGELSRMIFQDENYSFGGELYRDRQTDNLVGIIYDRAGPKSVWFNERYKTLQKALNGHFPDQVVRIVDSNEATDRFVVHVYTDRHPGTYQLVDLRKKNITEIAANRPWIDPARMQQMHIIQFKTAEGIKLDAYVTLPPEATKNNPPPLIVLPHANPWARDTWGWDREVQFLASRGYAVLQPNYRGSLGTDWRFPYTDRWDFVKMHDDVTLAAKSLIRSGHVDPDRVAIMGTSFGAYLALMGAVHEPDLYKCSITLSGIYDWETHYKHNKRLKNHTTRHQYFRRKMGSPKEYPEKYEAISPGRRVAQIDMPVFVAHGKDDSIVNVGEAKRLIRDLKKHDKEYEALLIGGEGHGTANLDSTVKLYHRIEKFLAKHL